MITAAITTNGRLTIPKEVRRKYGLKTGTCVAVIECGNGFEVVKLQKGYFLRYAGILETGRKMLKGLISEKNEGKNRLTLI